MKWTIPGTVLQIRREEADGVEELFSSMFLAGGMVLSQVCSITALEPYTVQNWVKRGFLSRPAGKRYTLRQLCRIIHINLLKSVLPMERICALLRYVNGDLAREDDDIIDDAALYFLFVRIASRVRELHGQLDETLDAALADYVEPVPGAKERVEKALKIMLTAWMAARLGQEAERMLVQLQMPADKVKM